MARDLALLVNPAAGRGAAARLGPLLRDRLSDAGFRVRELVGRDATESADLAAAAVQDGMDSLVVVGGDGLVHLAIQVAAGTAVALGVVPTGSGNDLARTLGLPRRDPLAAADVVVASRTRTIDLAVAGDRYFATVLASGCDAAVADRASRMHRPSGQLRYAMATLAELRAFRPIRYRLHLDDDVRDLDAMLIAVGNTPVYGGGLRICEGAAVDDGWLDVAVVKPVSKLEMMMFYPHLYSGGHVRHRQYERHRARTITLSAPGVVAYADGERMGALPLTVSVAPGALRVYAPQPAAEAPRP